MSTPRDSVSKASLQASNKNAHCLTTLKHELEVLDKEKEHALQNISHDTKQLKKHISEQRPLSASKSRMGSANPSHGSSNPGSGHGSPQPGTPKSPRSPSRKPSATGNKSHASSKSDPSQSGDSNSVPQIVVSNEAADKPRKKRKKSILNRRGSIQRGNSASRPGSESGSDTGGSPLSQSLNTPSGRSRSNSTTQPASPLVRRGSHCPDPNSLALGLPDSARGRSSSFSSIEPARRRGSVMEQWGSISERNRPTMGSFKGRRGSIDMENLLRDLSFGVQHSELMSHTAGGPSMSDKQWEELRKCRYLRVPSGDNSVEDINEEN